MKLLLIIAVALTSCAYGQEIPSETKTTALGRPAYVGKDNVLTVNIVFDGNPDTNRTVLVRALGPSLGIANALEDPTLEIRDANGTLAINDDWKSNQEGAIRATGLAPNSEKESAILLGLGGGRYTAIVRAKEGTQGMAMVEAYVLR